MSLTPIFYIDNNILRKIMHNPIRWDQICEICVPILGQTIQPELSWYSFFEYYGFIKEVLGEYKKNFKNYALKFNIRNTKKAEEEIDSLSQQLNSFFYSQVNILKKELYCKKEAVISAKSKRKKYEKLFEATGELQTILFSQYWELFDSNFDEFVHQASYELAWDSFCSLEFSGISKNDLRQIQLGIWNQLRIEDCLMPLGKLVGCFFDDLYKDTQFKGAVSDMVDSEGLTNVIFNQSIFITTDSSKVMKQRIEMILGVLQEIEKTLCVPIKKNYGKVFCLNKENFILENILEPQNLIFL